MVAWVTKTLAPCGTVSVPLTSALMHVEPLGAVKLPLVGLVRFVRHETVTTNVFDVLGLKFPSPL
jgi:hypothetical protein